MKVLPIKSVEAEPWLLKKHYARRLPSISYAFGLYDQNELVGVVTYGTPSSATLRAGVCGKEHADKVLELNRLCCQNEKNYASMLVGRSLRMLPTPRVIVSYADTEQGHVGYVYQATNFIYTGLSEKRTDWRIKGMEHLHSQTITDLSMGQENRAEWMRQTYGDDFYLQDRPRKHRYIYITGNKHQRADLLSQLKYPVCSYPKGDTQRYDSGDKVQTQVLLF